ncbi:MAG: sigma-54-dependent Fis family transcriptional regulator [Planctomycetota bacterium]|jgi:DNA-binding NtrC family response regulator|nr:MAG: sigma-54-dependent Fis family transcriptional regulator [Planctomycetota bacterium]
MTVRASSQSSLGRILVVDDDRRMASGLAQWLCGLGWHASAAGSPAEALQSLGRTAWDACILDGGLPGDGGQRIAAAVRSVVPHAGIVAIGTGHETTCDWADASVCRPASDQSLLEALQAARTGGRARAAAPTIVPAAAVLGSHPAMRHVLDLVDRIARTPATVLVGGESGTGKSLLARAIHAASGRAGRFVEVACGSLSESLLESELFGHVAGAYTGATTDRDGMFLRADGGTIFLDEIATASPAMQVKLLRVLQDMRFEPVGGSRTLAVDARVILATHEDLSALVAAGRFRADLFWRINVVTIEMPALRQRADDIPLLAEHFLRTAAARAGRTVDGFAAEAMAALVRHDWPGNVRELQHAVERGVFLGRGPLIVPADLPAAVLAGAARRPAADASGQAALKEALAAPERQLIVSALEQAGWRRDVAARALGINRTTLYKKLRRLGLDLAAMEPAR